jgi:hypothetical protein
LIHFRCKVPQACQFATGGAGANLRQRNQKLRERPTAALPVWLVWYAKTRNLVIATVSKKFTIPVR